MKHITPKALAAFAALGIMISCTATPHYTIKYQSNMFTAAQINEAHSKVKSGADFPAYIRTIKQLGVTHYKAYVSDGHVDYFGTDGCCVTLPPKYEPMPIATSPATAEFRSELQAHQQGKTDYLSFIRLCARTGIRHWEVCMDAMTCTYFDTAGHPVLEEQIPQ